jgi:5-hydroxyisourate hydrolase-like protein (transthyretin family)
VQRAVVNVYGQLTKISGQIVQTFEETLHKDIPAELLEREVNNTSLYWKALPMRPGLYRLDVVVKDVNGDKTGIFSRSYNVPEYNDDKLATSTLILADQMEPVPSREVGTGNFVIGTNKVRPKVQPADGKPAAFNKDKEPKVNLWLQVYNLGLDQKTNKPSATVEYQVVNTATNQHVLDFTESTSTMGNVGDQMTLAKVIPLNQLAPGVYQVTIKINDQISKQTISPTAKFAVQ